MWVLHQQPPVRQQGPAQAGRQLQQMAIILALVRLVQDQAELRRLTVGCPDPEVPALLGMISIIQLLTAIEAAVTRTHVLVRELLPLLRFTVLPKVAVPQRLLQATLHRREAIRIRLRQEASTVPRRGVIVLRRLPRQEVIALQPHQAEVADLLLPEVVHVDQGNVLQLPHINRVVAELPFKRSYFEG